MTRETKTMPSVIYAEPDHQWDVSDYSYLLGDGEQYHHTRALREKIEGMKKPHCRCSWPHCTHRTHNAALDAILAMMEEPNENA